MTDQNAQSGPPTFSTKTFMWVGIWESVWVIAGTIALIKTDSVVWLFVAMPIGTAPLIYVLFKYFQAVAAYQRGERTQDIVQ